MTQKSVLHQLRGAAILVGILIVLGGLAWWDNWKTAKDETIKASENKLIHLTEDQVSEIDYVSSGATDSFDAGSVQQTPVAVHLVKKDGQWQQTAPIEAKADDGTIKNILTTLRDYKFDKVITEGKEKWKDFGLDPPARRINLIYTSDGKQTNLQVFVGSKAPVGYSAYVATSESPKVFIGSQHIVTSINKTASDFRDKSIASLEEKTVKAFTYIASSTPPIQIEKQGEKFVITKPESLAADESAVKEFLTELTQLKAQDFADSPSADMQKAFQNPTFKITWSTDNVPDKKLEIAEYNKALWASQNPKVLAYKLPDDAKGKLTKTLTNFRDRKVMSFASKDAVELDVDGTTYKRVGADWYAAEDAGHTPPTGKAKGYIQSLIVDLEFAKADQFLDPRDKEAKSLPSAPLHRLKISFTQESKAEPLLVEAWDVPGSLDKVFLKHSKGQFLYRVPKPTLANISETTIKASDDKTPSLNLGTSADPFGAGKEGDVAN